MTLQQLWRFLRDCKVFNSKATIARFNRVYFKCPKNIFNIWITPINIPKND